MAFDAGNLEWRETYFVWFDKRRRPTLADVQAALYEVAGHLELKDASADESGKFESVTVLSAEDHAAVEITFLTGDDVREQADMMANEMKDVGETDRDKLARLRACDARLDLMHFEQVDDLDYSAESDEMLDPSTLLMVMEALTKLTGGMGIDPQSGIVL